MSRFFSKQAKECNDDEEDSNTDEAYNRIEDEDEDQEDDDGEDVDDEVDENGDAYEDDPDEEDEDDPEEQAHKRRQVDRVLDKDEEDDIRRIRANLLSSSKQRRVDQDSSSYFSSSSRNHSITDYKQQPHAQYDHDIETDPSLDDMARSHGVQRKTSQQEPIPRVINAKSKPIWAIGEDFDLYGTYWKVVSFVPAIHLKEGIDETYEECTVQELSFCVNKAQEIEAFLMPKNKDQVMVLLTLDQVKALEKKAKRDDLLLRQHNTDPKTGHLMTSPKYYESLAKKAKQKETVNLNPKQKKLYHLVKPLSEYDDLLSEIIPNLMNTAVAHYLEKTKTREIHEHISATIAYFKGKHEEGLERSQKVKDPLKKRDAYLAPLLEDSNFSYAPVILTLITYEKIMALAYIEKREIAKGDQGVFKKTKGKGKGTKRKRGD